MTKKELEKQQSLESLRKLLKPGDEVICILRHVSSSGMTRDISLVIVHNGQLRGITYDASRVLGYPLRESHGSNAIRVQGCGMDMGFHAVYSLSRYLFPQGFGIETTYEDTRRKNKTRTYRPSTPAEAKKARARGLTFRGRNGDSSGWDEDGGYALRHRWM